MIHLLKGCKESVVNDESQTVSVLPMTDQMSTNPLTAAFEDERKNAVFYALSGFFQQNMFCDVTLIVGQQVMRAHKMVLASSCKFFSNAFDHYPSLTSIDLERELAPHGISVTFDDVQSIILLLYCVGTVEISPQRMELLFLIAEIMVRRVFKIHKNGSFNFF